MANGCHIEDSLLMGNDNYSNDRERERAHAQGLSVLGIGELNEQTTPVHEHIHMPYSGEHVRSRLTSDAGEKSVIKKAIIDDNASIGRNVKITNKEGVDEADRTKDGYVVQNGIVVVLKGATIKDGTQI